MLSRRAAISGRSASSSAVRPTTSVVGILAVQSVLDIGLAERPMYVLCLYLFVFQLCALLACYIRFPLLRYFFVRITIT